MKKNKLTLAILAVFAFVLVTMQSCKKEELDASDNTPITKEYNNRSGSTYSFGFSSDTISDVMPPILTCDLPIFPFEVLYVVCKEYESVEDGTSSNERIMFCEQRAYEKEAEYYRNDIVKGDAFRHIFVNVMLRRYLSRTAAYMIMDVIYENINPNPPCHRYMDWHNNYVGRVTKYSTFRITNDWQIWSDYVHSYVDNDSNGVFKNWTTSTSKRIVKREEKEVDDKKYIYLDETTF